MSRRILAVGACCVIFFGIGSRIASRSLQHWLQRAADEDLDAIRQGLAVPQKPLPSKIGVLSPYAIRSSISIREAGGPEHARAAFVDQETGLEIRVDIHTCRPRVMHHAERSGELDLVDGTSEDLFTSGGIITIADPATEEEFPIRFKLVGTPGGTINWRARQFVRQRQTGETWQETLAALCENLEPEPSSLPKRRESNTLRASNGMIYAYDRGDPSTPLMSGPQEEMGKLLSYQQAFRDFYEDADSLHAQRIAWMMLKSLLTSKTQQELSRQWEAFLTSNGTSL